MMLQRFLDRIEEKRADASTAPVLICAFGDSVTQGCTAFDTFDFKAVYHNVLKEMLESRFPKTTFSVINAGVGGETAEEGLKRLDRDVLRHGPDLTLVAFGLNDATRGLENLPQYRHNLQTIFGRIRSACGSDIIAITPGFMASRPSPRIAKEHQDYVETILRTQNEGVLKTYVEALKETAFAMSVSVADVHLQWEKMAAVGKDTDQMLANGLNHPDPAGHQLAAQTILQLLLNFQLHQPQVH